MESKDASRTSARSAVETIRVPFFISRKTTLEAERDGDLPMTTRGDCRSAKLLGSFLHTKPYRPLLSLQGAYLRKGRTHTERNKAVDQVSRYLSLIFRN